MQETFALHVSRWQMSHSILVLIVVCGNGLNYRKSRFESRFIIIIIIIIIKLPRLLFTEDHSNHHWILDLTLPINVSKALNGLFHWSSDPINVSCWVINKTDHFQTAWKRYYECKICSTNIFLLKKDISQFAKAFLKWPLTRGMLKAYTQLHPSNNKIRTLWNDRKNG